MSENRREKCEYRERCGKNGHVFVNGQWERCNCLKMEIAKRQLGPFYSDQPIKNSPLYQMKDRSLLIEGPLSNIRPHVSGVLLRLTEEGASFRSMDAYRLIEIFLEKDREFDSVSEGTEVDLLILLLGFGDPPNRYLPELVVQTLDRREIRTLPTWVVLGIQLPQVAGRYSEALSIKLNQLKKVTQR